MAKGKALIVELADRDKVKGDLILRLERVGAADADYLDVVDNYMKLWDLAQELVADRAKRSLLLTEEGPRGTVTKINPSSAELVKVTGQMDKIFKTIVDAKPKAPVRDDTDDAL